MIQGNPVGLLAGECYNLDYLLEDLPDCFVVDEQGQKQGEWAMRLLQWFRWKIMVALTLPSHGGGKSRWILDLFQGRMCRISWQIGYESKRKKQSILTLSLFLCLCWESCHQSKMEGSTCWTGLGGKKSKFNFEYSEFNMFIKIINSVRSQLVLSQCLPHGRC